MKMLLSQRGSFVTGEINFGDKTYFKTCGTIARAHVCKHLCHVSMYNFNIIYFSNFIFQDNG